MNNKGADQPAHQQSLISAFVIPLLEIFLLVSVAEETSLSLILLKTPKTSFVVSPPI